MDRGSINLFAGTALAMLVIGAMVVYAAQASGGAGQRAGKLFGTMGHEFIAKAGRP